MASSEAVYPLLHQVQWDQLKYSALKNTMGGAGIPMAYGSINEQDVYAQTSEVPKALLKVVATEEDKQARQAALNELMTVSSVFHLCRPEDRKFEVKDGRQTIMFVPSPAQLECFKKLDQFNREQIVDKINSKTWFKSAKMPAEFLAQAYKGVVEFDEHSGQEVVRLKVNDETSKTPTQILVQREGKSFYRGTFSNLRKNCRVVLALRYTGLWFQQQACGASIQATRILVMQQSSLGESGQFNLGGMSLEIEDDFVPPTADADEAGNAVDTKPVYSAATATTNLTEQTVFNAPVTNSTLAQMGGAPASTPSQPPMF